MTIETKASGNSFYNRFVQILIYPGGKFVDHVNLNKSSNVKDIFITGMNLSAGSLRGL